MSQASAPSESRSVCVIEPERKGLLPDFREIWRYRELFWVLVMRDITARYKQTYLGLVWAVLVPLTQVLVFNVIFGLVGAREKLVSSSVPFMVTAFCGNLAWQIFASGSASAGSSIINASGMVKKVYFPRLLVPLSALGRALVDCLIMLGILVLLMAGYHMFGGCDFTPTWRLAFLPLFVGLAVLAALAVGVWLAALTARWRDLNFILPFLFQIGQYVSPVIYEGSIIPDRKRWVEWLERHHGAQWFEGHGMSFLFPWVEKLDPQVLSGINPMAGIIEGFRWSLFSRQVESGPHPYQAPGLMMLVSTAVVLATLFSGLRFFRKTERDFVDIL